MNSVQNNCSFEEITLNTLKHNLLDQIEALSCIKELWAVEAMKLLSLTLAQICDMDLKDKPLTRKQIGF